MLASTSALVSQARSHGWDRWLPFSFFNKGPPPGSGAAVPRRRPAVWQKAKFKTPALVKRNCLTLPSTSKLWPAATLLFWGEFDCLEPIWLCLVQTVHLCRPNRNLLVAQRGCETSLQPLMRPRPDRATKNPQCSLGVLKANGPSKIQMDSTYNGSKQGWTP